MARRAVDVRCTAELSRLVDRIAAGRLLPGVHRCLVQIETPRRAEVWTAAATTHPDDPGQLAVDAVPRFPLSIRPAHVVP